MKQVIAVLLGTMLAVPMTAIAIAEEYTVYDVNWQNGDEWYYEYKYSVDYKGNAPNFFGNSPSTISEEITKVDFSFKLYFKYVVGELTTIEGYDAYEVNYEGKYQLKMGMDYSETYMKMDMAGTFDGKYYYTEEYAIVKQIRNMNFKLDMEVKNSTMSMDAVYEGEINTETIYDPPLKYIDLPLEVGNTWEYDSLVTTTTTGEGKMSGTINSPEGSETVNNLNIPIPTTTNKMTYKVKGECLGKEQVETKVGTFDAYRISIDVEATPYYDVYTYYYSDRSSSSSSNPFSSFDSTEGKKTQYYSEEKDNVVKEDYYGTNNDYSIQSIGNPIYTMQMITKEQYDNALTTKSEKPLFDTFMLIIIGIIAFALIISIAIALRRRKTLQYQQQQYSPYSQYQTPYQYQPQTQYMPMQKQNYQQYNPPYQQYPQQMPPSSYRQQTPQYQPQPYQQPVQQLQTKPTKIRCGRCGNIIETIVPYIPFEMQCNNCQAKLILR